MAEERQFHLEIVTPDRQFFIGEAQELTVPAIDGSLGVLAGHEPAVTALEPGELRYRAGGEWHEAVVSQERLRQKLSMRDYYNSKAALARALARLKAAKRH